jgi:hypothetical protein
MSIRIYIEELDGPAVSVLRRAIAEVKQRWLVIEWVTKNLLTRSPPCFGKYVKQLIPAAFAVVSTYQPALGPRSGLRPVLLMCVIHKEGLCPNNGDIHWLIIMMMIRIFCPYALTRALQFAL